MIAKPQMEIHHSANFWPNRVYPYAPVTGFVEAGVEHVVEGSYDSAIQTLTSKTSGVSASYCVAQDGRIAEIVPPQHAAWANGIWETPVKTGVSSVIDKHWARKENMNLFTYSIEHEGYSFDKDPSDPNYHLAHNFMNPVQYKATLALQTWICQNYHIVPSRNTILRHADITSQSRANCPGSRFPLDQLISDLKFALSTFPPVQPNIAFWHSDETGYDVRDGFLMLFNYRGGIDVCGYPICNQFIHKETGLLTQIFEKCGMDYDPSAPEKYQVRNTNLGRSYLDAIGGVQNITA